MYESLMKWQTLLLVLFLVLIVILVLILIAAAVINVLKAKSAQEGDKVDDEQEL